MEHRRGVLYSPLLFSIAINDIFKDLDRTTEVALFADDGALWRRGRNVGHVVGRMQQAISNVEKWAFDWGFRFSVDQTKTVFFTRRKINEEFKIKLYGRELERVESFRYLGLQFDKNLLWAKHIGKLAEKYKKVLNVMRCLRGVEWGADRSAMRTIYTGLVRSVFDYGCFVYGSAATTHLKKLDVIQHKALRLCICAYKSTPVASLQVEMGEMPLRMRRDQLSLVYWTNLRGHKIDHPGQRVLLPCQEKEKRQSSRFGWNIEQVAQEMDVGSLQLSPTVVYPSVPPWTFQEAKVDLSLLEERENDVALDNGSVGSFFNEHYSNYVQIFTDASKSGIKVGVAYDIPKLRVIEKKRISDNLAVFTGELVAIWLALLWVESCRPNRVAIWSDSSSALISSCILSQDQT